MSEIDDKVIKAVLRDCAEDFLLSDLSAGPIANHLHNCEHFTDEETQQCHQDQDQEENMKALIAILNTKCDDTLDVLIEYLDKKNQMQPHLVRVLSAARDRRRINPYDEDDGEKDDLAPGDFYLTMGGAEIIRNVVMASPTARGKWLDIAYHIIKSPHHIAKLKSVNAGRPEKMIDMSLEFWIKGTETEYKATFDTLVSVLEEKKIKKLASEMLKVKQKLCNACEVPAKPADGK